MKIILVRHAKSDYDWSKWPTDSVRPLSPKGIERQHKVAKGMLREGLTFDEIWVSPYKRARQTLEIIQEYQGDDVEVHIDRNLPPHGDPDKTYDKLREEYKNHPEKNLLLVGHNPNMSSLLELLADSRDTPEMNTSDVAVCEMDKKSSKLVKFYPRKELY